MKKGLLIGACFLFILIVLMSFASAGWFSDFWGKITGEAIVTQVVIGADGWTNWLNRDGASGSGDYESKSGFTGVCDTPTNVECRVIGSATAFSSAEGASQVVSVSAAGGCSCVNANNPEGCLDYEVRFLCSDMATSSYCGDGNCDAGETCTNCPGDCGGCETSSTCEAGVYNYPQDNAVPSNNILHYTLWGTTNYPYAKGYCSIVRGCAGYKDVTNASDGTVVCRCEAGSFGCTGDSCTTSGYSSFVTIASVTCVECDEDIDCGEGSTCQSDVCVQLKENGIICSLSGQKRCYSDLYFQVPTGSTNCNDLPESVRNTMCGTKCPSIACNGDVSPLCDGGTSVYNTRSSSCGSSPYYHVDCRCFADGTYQEEILYTSCIKDSDCEEGNTCQNDICVQLKENGATCSLDFECESGSCGEILANEGDSNPESICHENPNKCVIDSTGREVNYGIKSCLSSKIFRTCLADPEQEISWGAQTHCASDKACFEGRGCLKHEFIFRLDDGHFPADKYVFNVENPPELEDAMELSDSCVGVSFRINKMPPDESDLDDFVSEMEARGYYYYITAGSSDFRTWAGFPITNAESPFILDIPKLCGYLKNEHAEGLYLHEMGRYVAGAYNDKVYDWENIEQVLACAKANKKKVIWSDFGSGGWTDVRYYIDHDNEARRIFETYGDVLVPLIADNTRTDEGWREDLPGGLSFEDIIHVSDEYCNGERGGSIQDWHWEAITGSLDVPALDIERYIGISYDEGGKYSQFEDSNWDKNEPQNHGEFYMGIQRGKNYICGVSPCVSSDCDAGFTCESPKCIGSYDKKINRYGNPSDWDANEYYGQLCERCNNAGNTAYGVDDLAWYEYTCVKNKFIFCWGVRWSQGKTYVANAYRAVSCEGLSESDCNSHSGCSFGSFLCAKP